MLHNYYKIFFLLILFFINKLFTTMELEQVGNWIRLTRGNNCDPLVDYVVVKSNHINITIMIKLLLFCK